MTSSGKTCHLSSFAFVVGTKDIRATGAKSLSTVYCLLSTVRSYSLDLLDPLLLRTLGLRFIHLIADSFADTQGRGYPLRLPKNAVSGDRASF